MNISTQQLPTYIWILTNEVPLTKLLPHNTLTCTNNHAQITAEGQRTASEDYHSLRLVKHHRLIVSESVYPQSSSLNDEESRLKGTVLDFGKLMMGSQVVERMKTITPNFISVFIVSFWMKNQGSYIINLDHHSYTLPTKCRTSSRRKYKGWVQLKSKNWNSQRIARILFIPSNQHFTCLDQTPMTLSIPSY